jgi:prolyl 4-hydroxylase
MSDVPLGGDTVFVELNVGMQPKKGSAIFWYNLHTSGDKDPRLRHAACPVIVGSKWGKLMNCNLTSL